MEKTTLRESLRNMRQNYINSLNDVKGDRELIKSFAKHYSDQFVGITELFQNKKGLADEEMDALKIATEYAIEFMNMPEKLLEVK